MIAVAFTSLGMTAVSCSNDSNGKPNANCGNGEIDKGEVCDGNVPEDITCESELGNGYRGTVSCLSDCSGYNTEGCSKENGNGGNGNGGNGGNGNGESGDCEDEDCDSENNNAPTCGNGEIDYGEDCDPKLEDSITCADHYFNDLYQGNVHCVDCAWDVSECEIPTVCGDGYLSEGEVCDPGLPAPFSCKDLCGSAFDGEVKCVDCQRYDTSACTLASVCGDGKVEGVEECEKGVPIVGKDCASVFGIRYEGELTCGNHCLFDISQCKQIDVWATCGNGKIDRGEVCDGDIFPNGSACTPTNAYQGRLRCNWCTSFDRSDCTRIEQCGNDYIDVGELCDSYTVPNGVSCKDLDKDGKYHSGRVKCSSDCGSLDYSECVEISGCYDLNGELVDIDYRPPLVTCGNGIIDEGEECDGEAIGNAYCWSFNIYYSGQPGCTEDCKYDLSKCEVEPGCGNGQIDPELDEECDSKLPVPEDVTCATLVPSKPIGNVTCSWCQYNTYECTSCGNGIIDSGEECDGTTFKDGDSCAKRYGAQYTGDLICNEKCRVDTSQCSRTCRDGKLDAWEKCDPSVAETKTKSCTEVMNDGQTYFGEATCTNGCVYDTSTCILNTCGNGTLESDHQEECDGDDFGAKGKSCATYYNNSFYEGDMKCDASCKMVPDTCTVKPGCGNGQVDPGEECDGTYTGWRDCSFEKGPDYVGSLGCTSNCTISTSSCTKCGNGKIDEGEVCDGNNYNGATCSSVMGGNYIGNLYCGYQCKSFYTFGCKQCGNGDVDAGEECDGSNFNGETCESLTGGVGSLRCSSSCKIDKSGCKKCGNGVIDAGEECDGSDLGGKTCTSVGGLSGSLSCNSSCKLDKSGCKMCGNGKRDSGEDCDGSDLGGKDCRDVLGSGYYLAGLKCTSSCSFDTSDCEAKTCGDGYVDYGEDCDPPGSTTSCSSLPSFSGGSGTATCSSGCYWDTSSCSVCGNGRVESGETCDFGSSGRRDCSEVKGGDYIGEIKCQNCAYTDDSGCTRKPIN